MRLLKGFPPDVVAVEVIGHVTKEDYESLLTPAVERAIAAEGKVKVLYLAGEKFAGYSPAAAWEDMSLGMMHLTRFAGVAMVTDVAWLSTATRFLAPMVPCPVRVFPLSALDEAKAWITER